MLYEEEKKESDGEFHCEVRGSRHGGQGTRSRAAEQQWADDPHTVRLGR